VLARLSPDEAEGLALAGERATWPKIEMIRNCTAVSRFIDAALARLSGASAATGTGEEVFEAASRV
jgi:hypothetical protein